MAEVREGNEGRLLGGGPARFGIGLGNEYLRGLICGAHHGKGSALDLADGDDEVHEREPSGATPGT